MDNTFNSPYPSSEFQSLPTHQVAQNASPVSMVSGSHSLSSNQLEVPFHPGYRQNSVLSTYAGPSVPTKRKHRDFEVNPEADLDVVAQGLITFDEALLYFGTFFQGCVSIPRALLKHPQNGIHRFAGTNENRTGSFRCSM